MNSFSLPIAFIEGIGGPELMMIMFIILLLFGGQKLPELARGLGKSVREFKKAAANVEDEIKKAIEAPPEPPKPKLENKPATPITPVTEQKSPPLAPPPAE